MVDLCPVVNWSENLTEKACLWSKMSGIQMFRQVLWLYHLNTGHPYCSVFRWIRCSVFRWLLYLNVQYLDPQCISIIQRSASEIPTLLFFCSQDVQTLASPWQWQLVFKTALMSPWKSQCHSKRQWNPLLRGKHTQIKWRFGLVCSGLA